jgi:superfamily II DNA or RNA helicase
MANAEPLFKPGDLVRARADAGRIGVVRALGARHGGIQYYAVFWGGPAGIRQVAEPDLVLQEEPTSPTHSLIRGDITGYHDFQRIITFHRLRRDRALRNNIYAFNASRTKFYPYQFKPLIKFLDSSNNRLLVCDEVGLGKTIEAGLILTELRARGELRTVFVVCPASLLEKWRMELQRRFAEEFRILRSSEFVEYLVDADERPEQSAINGIVSYETLRNKRVIERLEAQPPPVDLLIADEAHHMRNMGTLTRKAGALMGANADALIMLTATPVHLGNENLFSLLSLLDDEDFPDLELARQRFAGNEPIVRAQRAMAVVDPDLDAVTTAITDAWSSPWLVENPIIPRVLRDLAALAGLPRNSDAYRGANHQVQRDLADLNLIGHIFTRTRRRDVHSTVPLRKAVAVEITFCPAEKEFYDAVTAYVRAHGDSKGQLPVVVQWRINGIQRRAASSIPALIEHYRRIGTGADVQPDEDDPYFGNSDGSDDSVRAAWLAVGGIVNKWDSKTPDSKYEHLRQVLVERQPDGPLGKVIVFAFFRETLEYLRGRLRKDGIRTLILHGGIAPPLRDHVIREFAEMGEMAVLLSSRVGSEGLDFQFCNTVVNYDLPWNPMEVEQRIGRVDRIGQKSPTIHIVNLWTLGTIEERILRRLYDRIGVFERSIGALDEIVGETVRDLERSVLSRQLTDAQQAAEARRVEKVLDSQLRENERIESDAARFLGLDEFFTQEVKAIQSQRRYVTGPQLRRFVEDFLSEHAPGSRLGMPDGHAIGSLVLDQKLRVILQQQGQAGDSTRLLAGGKAGVPVTFDADAAFEHQDVEFLNVLHPMVQAVVRFYASRESEHATAQHVALRTDCLEPGCYLFVVYRLTINAGRPRTTLECVILDQELRLAASREQAEAILGEMVERGMDGPAGTFSLESTFAQLAVAAAERYFLERQTSIRDRVEEENEAFVERRLASLKTNAMKNMERVRKRIRDGEARRREQRYMRMLRGQEARLEGELRRKVADLEARRGVQLEHVETTAGILEVLS